MCLCVCVFTCCWVTSVVSDSVRPRPWGSPGKNTGAGCHCLLQCTKVKSESEVAQSHLTLRDLMDCSLPGSSVHGIFQARVLEWGATAFSNVFNTEHLLVGNVKSHRILPGVSLIPINNMHLGPSWSLCNAPWQHDPRSAFPRPQGYTSPWKPLQMQTLGPQPRPTHSETGADGVQQAEL